MLLNKSQLIDEVGKLCFSSPIGGLTMEATTGLEVAEVCVSEK